MHAFLISEKSAGSLETVHHIEFCAFHIIWDLCAKRGREKKKEKPEMLLNQTLKSYGNGQTCNKSSTHTLDCTMLLPCDCREAETEAKTNAFICSHFTSPSGLAPFLHLRHWNISPRWESRFPRLKRRTMKSTAGN